MINDLKKIKKIEPVLRFYLKYLHFINIKKYQSMDRNLSYHYYLLNLFLC